MSKGTFVIFAHKDLEIVTKLRRDLDFRGVPTESAEDVVRPGADFGVAIQGAIRKARVVLVVLSRFSAERSWVTTEISLAISEQMSSTGKAVIPVIIEPEAELPFFIKHLQYVDLSTSDKYQRGLSHLVDAVTTARDAVERPEKMGTARVDLLLAEREALELQRAAQINLRLERAVLLTSTLVGFLGVLASLFGGLVTAGVLKKFMWVNASAIFGFLAGMLTVMTGILVYILLKKKRTQEIFKRTGR